MFEVITQANPNDCQSLEILKEAYWQLGKQKEALAVARKLADAFMEEGQYSSAMMEYEGILQQEPDSPEIRALLDKVEAKFNPTTKEGEPALSDDPSIDVDFAASDATGQGGATLMATKGTRHSDLPGKRDFDIAQADDGNKLLAKFLIQQRLVAGEAVNAALDRVVRMNENLAPHTVASSLLHEIIQTGAIEANALFCGILDRTKIAYTPLDRYDVDRKIVKMLPESLTLGRLIVPFDILSRTVMIAMANPLDALGKKAAQQLLDYNIQWHLAAPEAVTRVLRDAYQLDSTD